MPRILSERVVAAGHASGEILAGLSFCFRGARGGQPQVAEFQAQGLPGDPQQQGGLVLTPAGVLQDARQQEPVQLAVRLRVEVADVGPEPQADEELLDPRLLAGGAAGGLRPALRGIAGRKAGSRTLPLACSRACLRTLCSSRMLPGHG